MIEPNCAVHYYAEAFSSTGGRIFGREAASAGFLKALVEHSGVDPLYCCAPTEAQFSAFTREVTRYGALVPARWISYSQLDDLRQPGCLAHPDPGIAELAWHRRSIDSTSFSLCGMTHTLCSRAIMDAVGALAIAPVEPWDALVCTSTSAKAVVEHLLASYGGYLAERFRCDIAQPVTLPVIPLGVDCGTFAHSSDDPAARSEIRAGLGIGHDDVALLYVGRLSYHAKAHPFPMYLAVEEVARRTGKTLHLLHFGWFANDELKRHFIDAIHAVAPSVRAHFLDTSQELADTIWAAADVFVSLADNLQETFGLTPIEAMAAGLPVVVSDWDGYRESVRHDIDGFRIPTLMPPAGAGDELAIRYARTIDTYDQYVGHSSQSVVVDVAQCAAALTALVMDEGRRRSMGSAGRQRARERFDWSVIVDAYKALWRELSERRVAAQKQRAPNRQRHPLRDDPFAVFGGYATCTLDANCIVEIGPNASPRQLQALSKLPMNQFAMHLMCGPDEIAALLDTIADESPILVSDLLGSAPSHRLPRLFRTLGWLAKMDALRVRGLSVGTIV